MVLTHLSTSIKKEMHGFSAFSKNLHLSDSEALLHVHVNYKKLYKVTWTINTIPFEARSIIRQIDWSFLCEKRHTSRQITCWQVIAIPPPMSTCKTSGVTITLRTFKNSLVPDWACTLTHQEWISPLPSRVILSVLCKKIFGMTISR